jgi:hypothetical protein
MDPELVDKLYKFYPEHVEEFDNYENTLYEIAKNIRNAYISRFIKKQWTSVPPEEFQVMKDCHVWHLLDKENNKINDYKIIELMIDCGANNWNLGLVGACASNNLGLMHDMVQRGANNWRDGFEGSCMEDSVQSAKVMLNIIEETEGSVDWNDCFSEACRFGSVKIIELLLKSKATQCHCGKDIKDH